MQNPGELARFLPALEDPLFKAGTVISPEASEPGVINMPYVSHSAVVDELVKAAYDDGWILQDFDWPKWAQTQEAKSLCNDQGVLARATPEQIARLLTMIIRQDRFAEGTLLTALDTGLILRIVQRAAAIG